MKDIFDLFNIINKEKIIFEEVNFKNNIDGIYYKDYDLDPIIGINNKIVSKHYKYKSILAEELGHHFTTVGDLTAECITYSDKIFRSKQELKAKRWAANYLITDYEFKEALLYPNNNINSLAEYFDVTEELIHIKIMNIKINDKTYIDFKNIFKNNYFKYDSCNI